MHNGIALVYTRYVCLPVCSHGSTWSRNNAANPVAETLCSHQLDLLLSRVTLTQVITNLLLYSDKVSNQVRLGIENGWGLVLLGLLGELSVWPTDTSRSAPHGVQIDIFWYALLTKILSAFLVSTEAEEEVEEERRKKENFFVLFASQSSGCVRLPCMYGDK